MRISVLTSLYPGPPKPLEGIFAERRWLGMQQRGHRIRIVQPLPRAPGPLAWGEWARIAAMPARERRSGIEVRRPRYLHLPRLARRNAAGFVRVGMRALFGDCSPAEEPEVVVGDYAWPAAMAATPLRERGIPFLINGRGSDVVQVSADANLREELASSLRVAGNWCGLSHDLVGRMDRLGGVEGRGRLVPNGVDFDLFRPRDRGEARARLELPPGVPIVLVVGYLIARKDPLLALEGFARAMESMQSKGSKESEGHCVFVGRGPLRDEVEARAGGLGLADRVHLVGEVSPDALAPWYAAADCLLLCSSGEGRPNVVLEALASGRPVVATAAGGTAEILEGWHDEMLVVERTPEAVAAKLAPILVAPPDAERVRASVALFSWEESCAALEESLAQACAEPR
jgi:teichuronic acid biosynthesis glycosyltransferase TuaC